MVNWKSFQISRYFQIQKSWDAMVSDAQNPCIARASAAIALAVLDVKIFVLHGKYSNYKRHLSAKQWLKL